MLKIFLILFFSTALFIAIKDYGLPGLGLMGAGFAAGLSVSIWVIERDRKKFIDQYVYFYDQSGKPVAPVIQEKEGQ